MIRYSLALLCLAAPAEQKPFGFSGMEIYKLNDDAVGPIVDDLNGDGRLDFGIANNDKARLEIFLQKSPEKIAEDAKKPTLAKKKPNDLPDDARFEKVLLPHESKVHAIASGDLDGDKAPEIVYWGDPPSLVILKRKGEKWEKLQEFKIKDGGEGQSILRVADVNRDGRNDIVLLLKTGVSLFLQNAQGKIENPVNYPTGLEQAGAMSFESPSNGIPALVLMKASVQNGVAVRAMAGDSLGPEWMFSTGNLRAVATLPGESELTIMTVSGVSGRLSRNVIRQKNVPDSRFESPPSLYPLPSGKDAEGRSIALGDANGDHRVDIVVSQPSTAALDLYLQRADGIFEAPVRSTTFSGSTSLQTGDFHQGGGLELLLVSPEERVVAVASLAGGKIEFPKPIEGVAGKPLLAQALPWFNKDALDLAVLCEDAGKYNLQIFRRFTEKALSIELPFLQEKPTRLLAVDIDQDGDRDLAIVPQSDPFGLVMNEAEGKASALSSEDYGGKYLLSGAKASSYGVTRLPGGREAVLLAKKNMGRAVALDKNRKLEVLEQYAGPEDSNIVGVARSAGELALLDEKSASILIYEDKSGEWKIVQEMKLPNSKIERLEWSNADPAKPADLVLLGPAGIQILRRGTTQRSLEAQWSYESDAKDSWLWLTEKGDFNADGATDLAVVEWRNRSLELLQLPVKSGEPATLGLQFEMFEEKRMGGGNQGIMVRAMRAADFSGDGKDDLLFLIHDRAVIYIQE